jgi:citronellol/citronellal dehydrogenase
VTPASRQEIAADRNLRIERIFMTQHLQFGFTDEQLASRDIPFRPDLFAGQTVVISGGGGGIGRATAWMFGRLGAQVAICGRNIEKLNETAKPMRDAGLVVESYLCNIRRVEEVEGLFQAVTKRFGGFDVLVNSAGGQYPQPAIDFTPKGWNAVIETNLTGTWYMMQTAAKRWMAAGKPGTIINVVAVVDRGMPGVAHTCAARAGVIALSKTVAVEWAPQNIRINCIAPGAIDTEGQKVYSEESRRRSAQSNPMMRFGDAFDVADAAIYFSGPSGKFVTGETLIIDGGGVLWGEFWVSDKPDYFKVS